MTLRDLALISGSCVAAAIATAIFAKTAEMAAQSRDVGLRTSRRFDPPLQTKLELKLEPVAILGEKRSSALRRRDTLVVAAGSCSACSRHAIDALDSGISEYRRVVFYYRASVKELRSSLSPSIPDNVAVVSDSNGEIHEALNAFFAPRLYELDADGSLIRIQSDPNNFLDFGISGDHSEHGK